MSDNKNFNSAVKPNTSDEKVKILTAAMRKEPVDFYSWNSLHSRMEVQKFVSAGVPDFTMYRFDTHGGLLKYKTPIRFNATAFTNAIGSAQVLDQQSKEYDVKLWRDPNGVLNIEPNDHAKVRYHGTGVLANPVTYAAGQDAVNALWLRIKTELKKARHDIRTAQKNPTNSYWYFNISDARSNYYYAIIRMKDCVLVSKDALHRSVLGSLRIGKDDLGLVKGDEVVLRGHVFKRRSP